MDMSDDRFMQMLESGRNSLRHMADRWPIIPRTLTAEDRAEARRLIEAGDVAAVQGLILDRLERAEGAQL